MVDGRDLSTLRLGDYRAHLGVVLPGQLPVRRHGRREHRLLAAGSDARRGARGEPHRPLRRVHRRLPTGLRHGRGRARHQALGRPAPARRDRARHPRRSAHPHPRRGDLEPRQRERGDDPGRLALAAPRSHHVRDRAPALDDPAAPTRSSVLEGGEIVERGTHARSCSPRTAATASSTTSSTGSSSTGSSIPARTSRPSCRGWSRRAKPAAAIRADQSTAPPARARFGRQRAEVSLGC